MASQNSLKSGDLRFIAAILITICALNLEVEREFGAFGQPNISFKAKFQLILLEAAAIGIRLSHASPGVFGHRQTAQ